MSMFNMFHNSGSWQEVVDRKPRCTCTNCTNTLCPDHPKDIGGWQCPKPTFAYRNGPCTCLNCRSNLPHDDKVTVCHCAKPSDRRRNTGCKCGTNFRPDFNCNLAPVIEGTEERCVTLTEHAQCDPCQGFTQSQYRQVENMENCDPCARFKSSKADEYSTGIWDPCAGIENLKTDISEPVISVCDGYPVTSTFCTRPIPEERRKVCQNLRRQTSGTIPSVDAKYSGFKMNNGPMTATIQEQCGINTRFPGTTEYMDRYEQPRLDGHTSEFKVNPTPNFGIHGRPLDQQGYITKETEYQGRYEWPDGTKIVKLPWLQK